MNKEVRLASLSAILVLGLVSFGSKLQVGSLIETLPRTPVRAPQSIKTAASPRPTPAPKTWTRWARTVGQSEAERERQAAIAQLKSIKNLKAQLLEALPTKDRAMALDVMSALNMTDLVDDLMVYMSADEDGFVTLTINSLMNENNQDGIIKAYLEDLNVDNVSRFSPATLVAILEPIGRLGIRLSDATIKSLAHHASPEVRSAALYSLRLMALTYHKHDQDQLVQPFLQSAEFQLRLQTVSILMEFIRSYDTGFENLPTRDDLNSFCKKEKAPVTRGYCLALIEKPKGQR